MKMYLLLISIWGYNGEDWVYTGNQYILKELFTLEQCNKIINEDNWNKHESNEYYRIQLDCVNKEN